MTKMAQMKKVLKKGMAALLLTSVMVMGAGSSSLALQCPQVGRTGHHYSPYPSTIITTYIPILRDDATGKTLYITYNEWSRTCVSCGTTYDEHVTIGHTLR